jgi:hypothetical protein
MTPARSLGLALTPLVAARPCRISWC